MPSILHRVGIGAPVEKVYETLTTVEGNRAWWDSRVTGDAHLGGTMTFFGSVDLSVIAAKPGELVTWKCVRGPAEWLNTEINFRLAYRQDQTFVLFSHDGWEKPVEFMHHCSTRWAVFLLSLKGLLERGEGRPVPYDVRVYVGE